MRSWPWLKHTAQTDVPTSTRYLRSQDTVSKTLKYPAFVPVTNYDAEWSKPQLKTISPFCRRRSSLNFSSTDINRTQRSGYSHGKAKYFPSGLQHRPKHVSVRAVNDSDPSGTDRTTTRVFATTHATYLPSGCNRTAVFIYPCEVISVSPSFTGFFHNKIGWVLSFVCLTFN